MTAQAPYESQQGPKSLTIADTTIAPHVALQAYGPRYGVDWVYHDDRLGYLPAMPVKTREELDAALPERAPVSAGGDAEPPWTETPAAERPLSSQYRDQRIAEKVKPVAEMLARTNPPPAPPVGADWVVVPRVLPPELLAQAAFAMDTGNPKHLWDFILAKLEARNA